MKYLRITTVPESLSILLEDQPKFLRENGFEVFLASSGTCPKDLENFPFISIPFSRSISIVNDIKALIKLVRLLRRLRPDIVHSHTPKAGLIGMIACLICGVNKRLHTVAGLPQDSSKGMVKFILNTTEQITYTCAKKIYFNSKSQLQSQSLKFPRFKHKFQVVHNGTSNGIDLRKFKPQKPDEKLYTDFNLSRNSFKWIFVGRVHEHKGIRELIEAYKVFVKSYPGTSELLIIGGLDVARNSLSKDWTQQIESENSSIRFLGFQSNIPSWLSIADALIFPSYREGFPNVPLQAACMGIPIIATDINGCNELITNEKNGFLVPIKSSKAIADKMILIYKSPGLRESMKKYSLTNIPKLYDRKVFHQKLLEEYLSLQT